MTRRTRVEIEVFFRRRVVLRADPIKCPVCHATFDPEPPAPPDDPLVRLTRWRALVRRVRSCLSLSRPP